MIRIQWNASISLHGLKIFSIQNIIMATVIINNCLFCNSTQLEYWRLKWKMCGSLCVCVCIWKCRNEMESELKEFQQVASAMNECISNEAARIDI